MKIAKPYKILALIIVFILSAACFIAFTFGKVAHADVLGLKYFSDDTVKFEDDVAKIKLKGDNSISINNELDLEDFALTFTVSDIAIGNSFTIKFTTDSLNKPGNKVAENEYNTKVEHELNFTLTGTETEDTEINDAKLTVSFNGDDDNAVTVKEGLNNVNPQIDEAITVYTVTAPTDKYLRVKIKYGAYDKTAQPLVVEDGKYDINATYSLPGKVSFIGTENVTINLQSIDQKYSDASTDFVQNFVKNGDDFENKAKPKVYLDDALYNYNEEKNAYTAICGYKYSTTVTAYSFLDVKTSDYKINDSVSASPYKKPSGSSYLVFTQPSVGDDDLKKVEVKGNTDDTSLKFYVIDYSEDSKAPKYIGDENAIDSFNNYVDGLLVEAKANKKTEITIEKNKLRSLVNDDYSSFSLMTATLYYWSDNSNSSSTSLKISLKDGGHFRFIILFTDFSGNAMEQEQFFYNDAEDTNKENEGYYKDFVFEFNFENETKLTIKTSEAGTGYKGVAYSCSAFTIEGDDYSTNYKLYYCKNKIGADEEGWKEIIAANKAVDEEKEYGDFTYDEIKEINYDGTLGFTPDRVGYYKFECTANSTDNIKSEKEAVVFEVKDQIKTVKPASHWLENNVLSVVFLSVGTLSLIGIIVLLFIKPKDEDSAE